MKWISDEDMEMTPTQLVDQTKSLASFPVVATRVSEVLDDESSSAADIGAIIEPDPALSAALLRIANSAAYNTGAAVDSVESAIKKVGMREVRDITFAISATTTFRDVPNTLVGVEDFWRHSLYSACAAQHLSELTGWCRDKSAFTAGLLHDIGHLVMFSEYPDESRAALQNHVRSEFEVPLCQFEHEMFGFDHTQVGEALAIRWQFPQTLRESIRYHHAAEGKTEHEDLVQLINVANSVAVLAEVEGDSLAEVPLIDRSALAALNLTEEQVVSIAGEARTDADAMLQIFVN